MLRGATPRECSAPDPDGVGVIGTALAAKAVLIATGHRPLYIDAEHQGVRIVGLVQASKDIEATGKA